MMNRILNVQSRTITVSAAILVVSSVLSKLLGIARDWLLAEKFGASSDLDVYFAAFRVPDFIYNILVFGGIVVAFLPLFSEYYSKNREEAWRFANNTLNAFLVFLVALCAILFLFTPHLSRIIAPGFDAAQMDKLILLTRLMFLSPILFGIASIYSGVLQYFNRFLAYSLAPVLYNLGIIAGILVFAPIFGIMGVAAGVIFGALMYLVVQIPPAAKCGFGYKPVVNFLDPTLKRVFSLMLPRTFGIAANQINQVVTNAIASTLAAGSVTIFNLANNLYSFPVGIFGVSYAMAAFPAFSRHYAEDETRKLAQKFCSTARQIGFIVLPISFLIFALRGPIVNLIYYHGKFTLLAAQLTSASLGLFAAGIYFAAIMPLFFRLFFAFQDTASPTASTILSVAANVFLNLAFIDILKGSNAISEGLRGAFSLGGAADISVLGLAAAYTLSNAVQLLVLLILLSKNNARFFARREIGFSFARAFAASVVMFVAVYFINANISITTTIGAIVSLTVLSAVGAAIYILAATALKSPELPEFYSLAVQAAGRMKKNGANDAIR